MVGTSIAKSLVKLQSINPFLTYSCDLKDYIDGLRELLSGFDLSIISTAENVDFTRSKCVMKLKLVLIHSSGETIESVAYGEGPDVVTAINEARANGLLCLINIASGEKKSTKEKPAMSAPAKSDEKNNSSLVVRRAAAIYHFEFDDISQQDLEIFLNRSAKEWDEDDLFILETKKDDTDSFRKIIGKMKEKSNA